MRNGVKCGISAFDSVAARLAPFIMPPDAEMHVDSLMDWDVKSDMRRIDLAPCVRSCRARARARPHNNKWNETEPISTTPTQPRRA